MILPRLGKNWSTAAGRWLVWERLYDIRKDRKATIWCRVSLRYLKTQRQMSDDRRVQSTRDSLAELLFPAPLPPTPEMEKKPADKG